MVALVVTVILAAAFWWLLVTGAGGPGGSRAESANISYNVEYVVRDSSGRVKEQGSIHNAVNDPEALNEVFQRITGGGTSQDYDEIGALSVDSVTDDPADGVVAASIALTLDGSAVAGDQNPANGTVATDFGTESGNGTVVVTFTATGSTNVRQIVLTKNSDDRTDNNGAADISDSNIFAYVDVQDVALNPNDSVTYTWTIDVD